ncbi:MAG: hypothetical protein IT190_09590, partial [Microbacteriaceae bacterium]|nr:hypothetical protein [Chrysiogenetes bacterium]MCC6271518.1 hypothetical protein [Microbacteriaceae bacterium]
PESLNAYAYSGNSPIDRSDPGGALPTDGPALGANCPNAWCPIPGTYVELPEGGEGYLREVKQPDGTFNLELCARGPDASTYDCVGTPSPGNYDGVDVQFLACNVVLCGAKKAVGAVAGAIASAIGSARSSLASIAFNVARWNANKELTALALIIAWALGGSCSMGRDLIWICLRVDGVREDSALTIGNVILTGAKKVKDLRPGLIAHEKAHATQWAALGAAAGLHSQALGGLSYILNLIVDGLSGANGCTLLAEWAAEIQSGDRGNHCS